MAEYIDRQKAIEQIKAEWAKLPLTETTGFGILMRVLKSIPAADVVEEQNILKFYYVRSIDEYWIGQRIDNFYYAEYDFKIRQWVWTHSRYLPWGEHVVSPTSLWKEHTYPSEPEEIPFDDWLQGFIKKYITAAGVRPVVLCRDCLHYEMGACLKIYDDGAANKDAWQERKPEDFCSYGEKREES